MKEDSFFYGADSTKEKAAFGIKIQQETRKAKVNAADFL